MRKRLPTALASAILGTTAFGLIDLSTMGLLDMGASAVWRLAGCFLGGLAFTLFFNKQGPVSIGETIARAVPIVFGTFVAIALGYWTGEVLQQRIAPTERPLFFIAWAVIVVSWWLIPLVALVLRGLNRFLPRILELSSRSAPA